MSSEPRPPDPNPATTNDGLQFERAEFSGAPALSCAVCKSSISGQYFQINGQAVCAPCRDQAETAMTGGSKVSRLMRSLGAGVVAAIGGFLVYWGIRAATGYEFALVAIVVGWMVGKAVRWGSQHRGGIAYQLLAVILTYFSIASTYCPDIIQGMRQARAQQSDEESANQTSPLARASEAQDNKENGQTNTVRLRETEPQEPLPLWFELGFAFAFSLVAPFLMGVDNLIGWIIIAVGLWEAWRLNKRMELQIIGPFNATIPAAGS
jgi:hypothetical protein